jgi:hypothetical protein
MRFAFWTRRLLSTRAFGATTIRTAPCARLQVQTRTRRLNTQNNTICLCHYRICSILFLNSQSLRLLPESSYFACFSSFFAASNAAAAADTSGELNRTLAIALCAAITAVVAGACCAHLARLLRSKSASSKPAVNDPAAALKSLGEAPSADSGGQLEMNALRNRPNTSNDSHSVSFPGAGVDAFAAALVSNPLFAGAPTAVSALPAIAAASPPLSVAHVPSVINIARASVAPASHAAAAAVTAPENVFIDVNPDAPSSNGNGDAGSAEPSAEAASAPADPYAGFRFENLGPDDYLGLADICVDVPHIKFQKAATQAVSSK